MASSFGQAVRFKDQSGSGSSLVDTYASAVAAGDTLFCFATCPNSSVPSVSDSVNGAWTLVGVVMNNGAVNSNFAFFVLQGSLAGTPTVTVTFSPANTFIAMAIGHLTGVVLASFDQYAYLIQSAPGTGTDAVTSGLTGPLRQPKAMIVGIALNNNLDATPATGTGFTNRGTGWGFGTPQDNTRMESKNLSSAAAIAATFTTASGSVNHDTFALIFIDLGPAITTQPTTQKVADGATATFSVSATTSGGTLHYQWHKNGSNVGTDSSSYTTGTLTMADDPAAVYCTVSDDNGSTDTVLVYARVQEVPGLPWFRA